MMPLDDDWQRDALCVGLGMAVVFTWVEMFNQAVKFGILRKVCTLASK